MKSLAELLLEESFNLYSGLLRVTFNDSILNQADAIDTVRGVETVTTARSVGGEEEESNRVTLSVKVRTLLTGEESFNFVREKLLSFSGIDKVEIGTKTITKL